MHGIYTYRVEVKGKVDKAAFNAASPIKAQGVRTNTAATCLIIHTDQSGLIGLMRHLHQQGFVLLSVSCERQNIVREEQHEVSNHSE